MRAGANGESAAAETVMTRGDGSPPGRMPTTYRPPASSYSITGRSQHEQ
jgi:hypothetical protein